MKHGTKLIACGAAAAGLGTWLGLDHLQDANIASVDHHNQQIEECLVAKDDLALNPNCLELIDNVEIKIGQLATDGLRPILADENVRSALNGQLRESSWRDRRYPEVASGIVFIALAGLAYANERECFSRKLNSQNQTSTIQSKSIV